MEKEDTKSNTFLMGFWSFCIHSSRNIVNASGIVSSQSNIYHSIFRMLDMTDSAEMHILITEASYMGEKVYTLKGNINV